MLEERMKHWRHAFKLDPNRALPDRALEEVCTSGTDAVIVGGTDGITYENSRRLIERISAYPVECVQEISDAEAVVPGVSGYLLPVVLNAGSVEWVLGAQQRAIKRYGDWIPWDMVAVLGYVVMNPASKVARRTGSQTRIDAEDVKAYARMAERMFRIPAVYVEYSGTYGDEKIVRAAREGTDRSHLFYGGGIAGETEARTMAKWADTVVVGNLVYRNVAAALETVHQAKEAKGGSE